MNVHSVGTKQITVRIVRKVPAKYFKDPLKNHVFDPKDPAHKDLFRACIETDREHVRPNWLVVDIDGDCAYGWPFKAVNGYIDQGFMRVYLDGIEVDVAEDLIL